MSFLEHILFRIAAMISNKIEEEMKKEEEDDD